MTQATEDLTTNETVGSFLSPQAAGMCQNKVCPAPDAKCLMGEGVHSDCPSWNKGDLEPSETFEDNAAEAFPWSGRPMGLVDLAFISGASRPHLIGMVGAPNAGKTTLLALLYRFLGRGHMIGSESFGGSFSLQGWENISGFLELRSDGKVQFPPHTSRQGRIPGLLHLSVSKEDSIRQLLFADSPGEWFESWVQSPVTENASGARWVVQKADKLLLIADRHALTHKEGGSARRHLKQSMRRLKEIGRGDCVALVWTKADIDMDADVQVDIQGRFDQLFPDQPTFKVGLPSGNNGDEETCFRQIEEIFVWASKPIKRVYEVTHSVSITRDPFLAYRESTR